MEGETLDLERHVVIAGFGRVGQTVARLLEARKVPYVALDRNPTRVHEARKRGISIFFGDASRPELLWGVGADRARALVIALDDPAFTARLVAFLRQKLPDLKIIVRARDSVHGEDLTKAGASAVVSETLEASLQLAAALFRALDMPDEDVGRTLDEYRAGHGAALGLDIDAKAKKAGTPSPTPTSEDMGKGA